MSARDVIEHALLVYYADSRDAKAVVGKLLAQYDAERDTGEKSSREADADATPRPTIYQASHDSIVMGWHTTIDAARVRCEAHASRNPHLTGLMNWVLHEPLEDDSAEELTVDDAPTGYVVTPLPVASESDGEAGE